MLVQMSSDCLETSDTLFLRLTFGAAISPLPCSPLFSSCSGMRTPEHKCMQVPMKIFILFMQIPRVLLDVSCASLCLPGSLRDRLFYSRNTILEKKKKGVFQT